MPCARARPIGVVPQWALAATIWALALCSGLSALATGAPVVVDLEPTAPAIPEPGVPALWAKVEDADRMAPGLRIAPAKDWQWVVSPGDEIALTVSAEGTGDRAVLTFWDWNCRPVAQHRINVPASEVVAVRVTGRGTYLLTLDAFSGDVCKARLARSFSVCPSNLDRREQWRRGELLVGTCSFPGRQHWRNDFGPANPPGLSEQEAREMDADLSARLGMVLVRPDLPVSWPAADREMDFTLADKCMECFTSRGFRLALQIGFPLETGWTLMPQYEAVTDPKWRYPRREEVVRKYAEAVAARYGPHSEFIELYNEPDNADFWRGTVQEFVDTHQWMAESVRKGYPQATIISGGLCLVDPERTGMIARGIRPWVDAVGYHSHGGVDNLSSVMVAMRAVHAASGYDRPTFMNTEMGFANWRLDMERNSAATAVQKLLFCWAHGNKAALLYCSRDIGGPRGSGDWGYIDYFMCPRFTYGAVAAFMDYYAGATFAGTLTERNGLYVYEFRKGDQRLVPVFTAGGDARPVRLETDAQRVLLLDPMGNATSAEPMDGAVALTAGLYPQTVVLEGAGRVSVSP
ncbi:MAG: hypothetical protein HPY44_14625 [Armatimonadetes bacterium]|nr:hypothetical protein [Armatimonadota bacterium]